jgi:hypothetical protein
VPTTTVVKTQQPALTDKPVDATIETSQKNNKICKDPTQRRAFTKQVDW